MTGNVLIIIAQVIVAVQMVVEEKLIGGYDIPALQVVGWEGLWGVSILSAVLAAFYFVPTAGTPLCAYNTGPNTTDASACGSVLTFSAEDTCAHVEDAYDAAVQVGNNPMIGVYTLLNVCSIAFFNFFGVSVTKHVNAATRMVLDSCRTMVIWGVSLGLGWEKFCYLQVIGFALLLGGTVVYNQIVRLPGLDYTPDEDAAARADDAEDDTAELLLAASSLDDPADIANGSLNQYAVKNIK